MYVSIRSNIFVNSKATQSVSYAFMAKPLHEFQDNLAWRFYFLKKGHRVLFTSKTEKHINRAAVKDKVQPITEHSWSYPSHSYLPWMGVESLTSELAIRSLATWPSGQSLTLYTTSITTGDSRRIRNWAKNTCFESLYSYYINNQVYNSTYF